MKRILKSKHFIPICYSLFFISVFVVFFYSSFPEEAVKQRMIYEIGKRTPLTVEIKNVSISPITRITAYGVNLYKDKELFLVVDEWSGSPSLLYLIINKLKVPFEANLYGGEAEGTLFYDLKNNKITKAEGKIENGIDIGKISAIPEVLGGENSLVQGVLNGDFSLEFSSQPKGDINLTINDLMVKGVKIAGGFPLPDFGKMQSSFKSHIEKGVTKVDELKFKGSKIDLTLSGTMPLLWQITKHGTIDLSVSLKADRDVGRTITGLLSAFLATQRDGSLGGKIIGTISRPEIVKQVVNNR